ncbi:MAG: nitrite/sulfite reductase [Fusicatenibacter sp.]|nr:nitrite/sulfite reductase [Lachnospiraceae bacterium]MDY2937438.1 nitrite/sulfite reductase [Fusicatenibacter sp.]
MEKLMQEFRDDLSEFREKTDQFYAGEVSMKDYKGFSGGFGSYAQKGGKASMIRLRMAGGRMTKEKLKFIADVIAEYGVDKAHFTTCQTVQLHNLDGKAVCEIMEKAMDVGIVTRGGGGDFPRNTMVSPLSGVEAGEYFDVLPYAEAAADYLLTTIKTVKMPRKLKVGFSNSPANVTHATFRDLGFAAREDGKFDVYSAGGLGNNPRMGVKVAEAVDPSEILFYIRAMIDTFVAYGNYENRAKARTRYMQETLGEGYKAAFLEKLAAVREREDLTIQVEPRVVKKTGDGSCASGDRVIPQKQEGLYAVAYHPIGGLPAVGKFAEIYEAIRDAGEAEVRIAPDETIYVINLTGAEAERVLAVTEDGAKNLFETSVSCIGSTICQIGLRNSQGLLASIVEEVRKYDFADGVLPRIHISGCTSSCGTHQIGTLGFHGAVKKVDGKPQSGFTFHVNGSDVQGEERFGEEWGVMLESEIPSFFVDLGKAVEAEHTTFDKWFAKDPEKLRKVAEKYL